MKHRVRLDFWADTERAIRNLKPQGLKHKLQNQFEALEQDPEQFEELRSLSPIIKEGYPGWTFRKIKLTHQKHDYRVLFAHRDLDNGDVYVAIFSVFRRKEGYPIDWEWLENLLGTP